MEVTPSENFDPMGSHDPSLGYAPLLTAAVSDGGVTEVRVVPEQGAGEHATAFVRGYEADFYRLSHDAMLKKVAMYQKQFAEFQERMGQLLVERDALTVRLVELQDRCAYWREREGKRTQERDWALEKLSAICAGVGGIAGPALGGAVDALGAAKETEPERRPDGTLKPEAKPWKAPVPSGDTRKVGG